MSRAMHGAMERDELYRELKADIGQVCRKCGDPVDPFDGVWCDGCRPSA